MENNNNQQETKKGKKNPLLAQASAAAADTYTAPAPAPPRRSGCARNRQASESSSKLQRSLTKKEKKQVHSGEEVARCLEDEEDEPRFFSRSRLTRAKSSTSESEVQLNLDRTVAQAIQRQEGLKTGLGTRGQGDLAEDDSLSEAGTTGEPEKVKSLTSSPVSLSSTDILSRQYSCQRNLRMRQRREWAIVLSPTESIVPTRRKE
jgi:hypothetical protein